MHTQQVAKPGSKSRHTLPLTWMFSLLLPCAYPPSCLVLWWTIWQSPWKFPKLGESKNRFKNTEVGESRRFCNYSDGHFGGTYKSITGWNQRIVGLTVVESSPGSCPAWARRASVIRQWPISQALQSIFGQLWMWQKTFSYILPTWCSQWFLLVGSNSDPMELPTSRSGYPPHNCPLTPCDFLMSPFQLLSPILKASQLLPSIWHGPWCPLHQGSLL